MPVWLITASSRSVPFMLLSMQSQSELVCRLRLAAAAGRSRRHVSALAAVSECLALALGAGRGSRSHSHSKIQNVTQFMWRVSGEAGERATGSPKNCSPLYNVTQSSTRPGCKNRLERPAGHGGEPGMLKALFETSSSHQQQVACTVSVLHTQLPHGHAGVKRGADRN